VSATVAAPGLYRMAAAAYHADPAPAPSLSSSLARLIVDQSPAHAKEAHPRLTLDPIGPESKAIDRGAAMHELLLGGESRIQTIDAADWRTRAAQAARAEARAAGRIPVLAADWPAMARMLAELRRFLAQARLADVFEAGAGEAELSGFWQEGGIWRRARFDWLDRRTATVWDYKTTALPLGRWRANAARDPVAAIQPIHYRKAALALTGRRHRFAYVVQEVRPPFAVILIEPGDRLLKRALTGYENAAAAWRAGLERGHWPAYPARLDRLDPPTPPRSAKGRRPWPFRKRAP